MVTNASFEILLIFFKQWALKKERSALVSMLGGRHRYKTRWGVLVGDTHIIVHASAMTGRKYICGNKGRITLEKQWSRLSQPYALQTTRKDILVHDPSFTQYR